MLYFHSALSELIRGMETKLENLLARLDGNWRLIRPWRPLKNTKADNTELLSETSDVPSCSTVVSDSVHFRLASMMVQGILQVAGMLMANWWVWVHLDIFMAVMLDDAGALQKNIQPGEPLHVSHVTMGLYMIPKDVWWCLQSPPVLLMNVSQVYCQHFIWKTLQGFHVGCRSFHPFLSGCLKIWSFETFIGTSSIFLKQAEGSGFSLQGWR